MKLNFLTLSRNFKTDSALLCTHLQGWCISGMAYSDTSLLPLSWRRSLYYRNQFIDCSANQWTGVYMIGISVMKELNIQMAILMIHCIQLRQCIWVLAWGKYANVSVPCIRGKMYQHRISIELENLSYYNLSWF